MVVTDGIIHSFVDANRMILCQGRRAQIVGGRLRASEEVNSKVLGSVAGTETVVEVGYDPRSRERLAELEKVKAGLEKTLEETELNIKTLENLLRVQRKLPPKRRSSSRSRTRPAPRCSRSWRRRRGRWGRSTPTSPL